MKTYYNSAIGMAVEEFVATGFVSLPRWLLLRAYGQERMSKSIWRDLISRIEEEGVAPSRVYVREIGETFVLINRAGTDTIEDRAA